MTEAQVTELLANLNAVKWLLVIILFEISVIGFILSKR